MLCPRLSCPVNSSFYFISADASFRKCFPPEMRRPFLWALSAQIQKLMSSSLGSCSWSCHPTACHASVLYAAVRPFSLKGTSDRVAPAALRVKSNRLE